MAAACESCAKSRRQSLYLSHLWMVRAYQRGGYRFRRGDLPAATWMDLGVLDGVIESMRPSL